MRLQSIREVLAALVAALAILIPVPFVQGASSSHPSWTTYTSQTYHVTLQYPAHWHQVEGYGGEKHGGTDGFFQLSAWSGGEWTLEEACEFTASQLRRRVYLLCTIKGSVRLT